MNLAMVSGTRTIAQPGLKGICPGCDQPTFAKCGKKRVWHWAHKVNCNCPLNKEETEWHRDWKNHFPLELQEIYHIDSNGERHFADVKTYNDWILEFQHSPISEEERQKRNEVYIKIVWVVHVYRKNQIKGFFDLMKRGFSISTNPYIVIVEKEENSHISEWSDGSKPILFDIEGDESCWLMLPIPNKKLSYFVSINRNDFINMHQNANKNCSFLNLLNSSMQTIEKLLQAKLRKKKTSYITIIKPRYYRRSRRL